MRKLLLLLLPMLFLSGCLSMFRGHLGYVEIITDPPGAAISYQKKLQSFSPSSIELPRDRTVAVLIRKEGYQDTYVILEAKPNGWLWVASILANATHGLLTFGISAVYGITFDVATGAMNEFENPIFVRLRESKSKKRRIINKSKNEYDKIIELIPFEEEPEGAPD